jgi:hypothetical protein
MPEDVPTCSAHSHTVSFYANQAAQGRHVVAFLEEGLRQRETVLRIAARDTREAVRTHPPPAKPGQQALSSYQFFDADELLSSFFRNGSLDREQLFIVMERIFRAPATAGKSIRVYGEMVVRFIALI